MAIIELAWMSVLITVKPLRSEPDPIDVRVGARIKSRRLTCGWSQDRLAACLGVSFQQLQKYESGVNRISASMLQRVSTAMAVPISEFFDPTLETDHVVDGQALQLAAAIERLPPAMRQSLAIIVDSLKKQNS